MVKNYDFVITSGGIGPTHDGRYTLVLAPRVGLDRDCRASHFQISHTNL